MDFDFSTTIRGDAFAKVVGGARRTISRWLDVEPGQAGRVGSRTPGQIAVSKASNAWSTATDLLDDLPELLNGLPDLVVPIRLDRDLNLDAKTRRVDAAFDTVSRQLDDITARIMTALGRIDTILRKAATPTRPGDTAADEARYAAAKTDLRMILDALPNDPTAIAKRMGQLLARAISEDDRHTAWVLGATRWPTDYAGTRSSVLDEATLTEYIGQHIDETLDDVAGGDFTDARRAFRGVVSPAGLWALEAALGMVPGLLEDVRAHTQRHVPDADTSPVMSARMNGTF